MSRIAERRHHDLLIVISCKTGEILLSLILFGKDVSSGPKLRRLVQEERPSASSSSMADDSVSMISPTSSMDMSEFSNDISSFTDVPGSPSLRVR